MLCVFFLVASVKTAIEYFGFKTWDFLFGTVVAAQINVAVCFCVLFPAAAAAAAAAKRPIED
jgi:hypothetical protein